jgi:3-oxoacyl-[acyl-carrier protein] reductase
MADEFTGKTAMVTGASRGIGAATAVALARRGVARVIVHYNTYREGAEDVVRRICTEGVQAQSAGADLGTLDGIRRFVAQAPQADILVNNAGSLVKRAKLLEMTEEVYDRIMNLNVKSAWMLAQAVVPSMIERGGGIIVNLSSIAARNGGGPGATVYAGAKAAIMTMTKGLARELAPKGIRVNAVSPGTVDNYFHEQFSTREILNNVVAQTPLGRLATNEDIADVIVFLCSDAARYVHGQTIEVNGGMLAP